jgi:putative glycosyltransferase
MKLSIVATLYYSAAYIDEFCRRSAETARQLVGNDFEIVLVNDGSPDDSLAIAIRQVASEHNVRVIDLSRNFGHHKAIMTGLAHSRGEKIFLIDSDLEEDPEWLLPFERKMESVQCDVVFGVQQRRKGNWFERWSGYLFYKMFHRLTGLNLPENMVTARLMSRRYVEALLLHKERELMLAGLWHITGFDQRSMPVVKHSTSKTTYTLRRKFSHLINSVTSFSDAPLKGIFYVGVGISVFAAIYISYLVANWMFFAKPLSGWTSVMASVWLLGGLIMSMLGVVGIYLSKIYQETKQRPYTVVREIYEKK